MRIPAPPVAPADAPAPAPAAPALRAEDVYTRAISEIKSIISITEKGNTFADPIGCIEGLVDLILADNEEIVTLADRATPDIYLYGHCVNVSIFSLLLGNTLGVDRPRLVTLGYCAFLHDIGMAKNLNLALKKEKFTEADYIQIKKHPQAGQLMLQNLPRIAEDIRSVIQQVAALMIEKKGAQATLPLRGNDIQDFAHIIAVADVYEALTHPRSYRERFIPHEALKMMIASANEDFGSDIIKAFIERVSLYPLGSYVRLNTEEVARVIGINHGLPTRPRVKLIVESSMRRPAEPRIIDLAKVPVVSIKEAIDETKLNLPDKKLTLELKAIRWWVKGL